MHVLGASAEFWLAFHTTSEGSTSRRTTRREPLQVALVEDEGLIDSHMDITAPIAGARYAAAHQI